MLRRLFLLAVAGGLACAQPVVQLHVRVPMRDGVRLCTNVFRPSLQGRFPAVLHRTPYRKASQITASLKAFLDRGYAVVTQDVRGRYDSEGAFEQVLQEEGDAADTLSWIARQPWSDGRVAMYGGSYVGIAQWRAALSGHPALKAIAPAVAGGDEYFDRYYSRGGAFRLAHRLRWIAENFKPANRPVADFQKMITFLPLGRADRFVAGRLLDFYQEAMAHPAYDAYWRARSTRLRAERVRTPALIEAGWYDPFLPSDIEMWKELRARGRPARLIIGPWGHNLDPQMPGADFGPSAALPLRQMELDWFDAWVRHSVPPAASAVLYFVMGAGEWRESAQWPPEGVEREELFLDSGGAANTLHGDGRLLRKPPAAEAADRYDYDPKRAVPTLGGATCCNFHLLPWGPLDQRPAEGRRDVLVYTTEALREPLEIAGPVRAVLYVSTSAPDTDFTAKLVDVAPDGEARILTDGILRLRYREGVERVVPYRPGTVVEAEIAMGHTAHEFRPGHAVRLEVSSSNFPKFDRNLNTGRSQALETQMRVARQAVWHGPERPSRLELPVLRRGAKPAQGRLIP
ncbi:MAG: CocE/NonD family hydrolase [Bryobacteraceae bacterium]|nr:CocE/NonD family hydrolase [Bryobacteraceae bacterium]